MADPTTDQNGVRSGPRAQVRPPDPALVKAAMMAKSTPNPTTQPTPGSNGSSSPGSPGLGGAISDAIGAAGKTLGPQAITQRKAAINQGVTKALGDEF